MLIKGRLPEITLNAHRIHQAAQQVPRQQILFADGYPVLQFALLDYHLPKMLGFVVVAKEHVEEDMAALEDSSVELL